MSNHFHLLVEVPPRPKERVSDEWILEKLALLYSPQQLADVRHQLGLFARVDTEKGREEYEAYREKFLYRMWDLGQFMKTLKQRFTQWYNRHHGVKGTLWEQQYKSVIVESGEAARVMAAYIDLNPVRAGIVQDPKDYRWCGYAEAVVGATYREEKLARMRLVELMKTVDRSHQGAVLPEELQSYGWRSIAGRYRLMLFEEGRAGYENPATVNSDSQRQQTRRGFTEKEIEIEKERGGKLSLPTILRSRIRYFSDGAIIGSNRYVEEVFQGCRAWFGPKRRRGSKVIQHFVNRSREEGRSSPSSQIYPLPKLYAARQVQE